MKSNKSYNKKAFEAGLWYTACNFIVRGINFLTTPLFTRIISKTDYGNYANYSSWLSLLTVLATLDLYSSISRAKFDYKDDLDGYVCSIQVLGTLATAACFILVHIFPKFFVSFFGMDMSYINIMFLYLMVSPSLTLLQTKDRQLMKFKAVSLITLTSTLLTIICSVVLVFCMEDDFLARVIGNTAVMFAFCFIVYVYNICLGRKIRAKYWKYALAISVPLMPHLLAGNILGTSDRIMITQLCGSESTALYSVIYSCSQIVMLLFQSINQAWTPWFYQQLSSGNKKTISKATKIYIVCAALILTLVMLASPEIVLVFGGTIYAESASIMPPIMLGCFYWCMYTFFINTEIYYKKTFSISTKTIIAALANLMLNYIFIQLIGWQAAAYTTLFGYFLLLILHSYTGKKLGTDEFIDRKFIYIVAAIMFLVMIAIRLIYPYFYLRLMVFVIILSGMLFFIVKHKDMAKKVLKK